MSDARGGFWVGTSWKMNKTLAEAEAFCDALRAAPQLGRTSLRPFVIPPFTAVREVARALAATPVRVGAQNMHWADHGAWTGEISAPMLVECGIDLVELGHSERRTHFGETDATVGRKTEAALRHGLTPLICIGEHADDKEAGRADEVLATQVRAALAPIGAGFDRRTILLAYEPVWAIGESGTPASPDYADARHARILDVARTVCPDHDIACLYGGSVNAENCEQLAACPHIDGLFIGRAAWSAPGYLDILGRVDALWAA